MELFPAIDVVVPAFNEEAHIGACLDSVLGQEYPPERVRLFVVDAGSEDSTAHVVRTRQQVERRLELLAQNGRLNAAEAFNLGYRAGGAPLVARVDAHSVLAPDYLARAAQAFARGEPRLACVGGQPRQVGETPFGRAVAHARSSRFGVGGSVYAERRQRCYVYSVQTGVYRRAALEAVGGFATDMLVGEDEEVNWRLVRAGWLILLDQSLQFTYKTRDSWRALFRQHRNYGRSRVRVIATHPTSLKARHLAPAAFVAGGVALSMAGSFSSGARRGAAALAALYGSAAVVSGRVAAGSGGEPDLALEVAKAYAAMHVGYGVGVIEGAVELALARMGVRQARRTVRAR
jgi:cellulose synthase/poly-beta-1,6-N-acetylglucosamine synthase-like glycosyltransferase